MVPLLGEGSCSASRPNGLLAYLVDSDDKQALGGLSLGPDIGPAAHAVWVFSGIGDPTGPAVGNDSSRAPGKEDVACLGLTAGGNEAMVTEMIA